MYDKYGVHARLILQGGQYAEDTTYTGHLCHLSLYLAVLDKLSLGLCLPLKSGMIHLEVGNKPSVMDARMEYCSCYQV